MRILKIPVCNGTDLTNSCRYCKNKSIESGVKLGGGCDGIHHCDLFDRANAAGAPNRTFTADSTDNATLLIGHG